MLCCFFCCYLASQSSQADPKPFRWVIAFWLAVENQKSYNLLWLWLDKPDRWKINWRSHFIGTKELSWKTFINYSALLKHLALWQSTQYRPVFRATLKIIGLQTEKQWDLGLICEDLKLLGSSIPGVLHWTLSKPINSMVKSKTKVIASLRFISSGFTGLTVGEGAMWMPLLLNLVLLALTAITRIQSNDEINALGEVFDTQKVGSTDYYTTIRWNLCSSTSPSSTLWL